MCISIDPRVCTSDVYPVDGYAPSCSFTCLNEGMQEVVNYQTGTFCFVKHDDGSLHYLGHCKDGQCVPENRDAAGNPPPQWNADYHVCDDKISSEVVKNCTYICKKDRNPWELPLYFYGIYEGKCKLETEEGICRSGFCHSGSQFPKIDDDALPIPSK
uniref:Putative basic tail protein n=1 Tax=Ixodes ricinus TaxID=34613 RepID=A0A0K8R9H6_IXORI